MPKKKRFYSQKEFTKKFRVTGLMLHNAIITHKILLLTNDKIDIDNPLNKAFAEECLLTAKRRDDEKKAREIAGLGASQESALEAEERENKSITSQIENFVSQESAIKLEIKKAELESKQIQIKKHYSELIGIGVIHGIFGKLGTIARSMILSIGQRTTEEISSIVGGITEEKKVEIRGIIDIECSRALQMMLAEIDKEITNELE